LGLNLMEGLAAILPLDRSVITSGDVGKSWWKNGPEVNRNC